MNYGKKLKKGMVKKGLNKNDLLTALYNRKCFVCRVTIDRWLSQKALPRQTKILLAVSDIIEEPITYFFN